MATGCWLYFISKFTEFLDTFFFILRKRYDQVSTLHVIHHGIMPFSVWWGVKFIPGGHATFFGLINTFVHIIMYTYYGLAAMGPHMHKYLWWKKYLTTMQIVQFIMVLIHASQLMFRNHCDYPIIFSYVIMGHAIMFYMLFSHFYKVTYIQGVSKKFIFIILWVVAYHFFFHSIIFFKFIIKVCGKFSKLMSKFFSNFPIESVCQGNTSTATVNQIK